MTFDIQDMTELANKILSDIEHRESDVDSLAHQTRELMSYIVEKSDTEHFDLVEATGKIKKENIEVRPE